MQLMTLVIAMASFAMASASAAVKPQVHTAERVYQTIIKESPFMVLTTSTIVWTQSPSITTPASTIPPSPTIVY
ncbi:hypothetical protein CPC08DRAFT_823364 [Agrocybe pediades]|nr:hypothetical protein CPC08DRAFT_823364 [Agrocybe pediades]